MNQPLLPSNPWKKRLPAMIAIFVLVACVVYIIQTFDFKAIIQVFSTMHWGWFLLGSIVPTLVFWWLRALRWHGLLHHLGQNKLGFTRTYLMTAILLGVANFTPAQLGEAFKVEWIRKIAPLERSQGYGSFIVERLMDLYVLFLLGLLGSTQGVSLWSTQVSWVLWGLVVLMTLLPSFIWLLLRVDGPWTHYLEKLGFITFGWKLLLKTFCFTLLGFLLVNMSWWCAFYSIGLEISWMNTMSLVTGVTVLSVLSMTGGLGVVEVALAELLQYLGYSSELAQAGALVIRGVSLLGLALSGLHMMIWYGAFRRLVPSRSPEK